MRDTHRRPIADKLEFVVRNTKVDDSEGIRDAIARANGFRLDAGTRWLSPESISEQLRRFPEGQFVAVVKEAGGERVVGAATTMRTRRGPHEEPLRWMEMIGSYGLANHDPKGNWLYGVEIAVHPDYQRRGVASALYRVRLELVEKLGLDGWYAGGMLMGYHRFRDSLSQREYYRKVLAGELEDPTVTMQMHRGLEARGFIENYCDTPRAGNAAVLLVWRPNGNGRLRSKSQPERAGAASQR